MSETVSSQDFLKDFQRYRELARSEAVPVATEGQIDGYFLAPSEYEALKRAASRPRVFAVEDLPDDLVEAIANTHMDPRHAHLDALLDED